MVSSFFSFMSWNIILGASLPAVLLSRPESGPSRQAEAPAYLPRWPPHHPAQRETRAEAGRMVFSWDTSSGPPGGIEGGKGAGAGPCVAAAMCAGPHLTIAESVSQPGHCASPGWGLGSER